MTEFLQFFQCYCQQLIFYLNEGPEIQCLRAGSRVNTCEFCQQQIFSYRKLKQSNLISVFHISNSADFNFPDYFKFNFSDFSCASASDKKQNQKEKQTVYDTVSGLSQLQTMWFEEGQKLYKNQVVN